MNISKKLTFKLQSIPKKPGCYLWKDKKGKIIYIGKAKNIFNRVHQYFTKTYDYKTNKLVNKIDDVEFVVVTNENEALILENNLIKKYRPEFNILLKDSSNYPYIVVTDEKNPRIKYTRNQTKYKGSYYGPFASKNFFKKQLFNLLNELFPLRKCDTLPHKKCLYYDMGQCLGPCINNIDCEVYEKIKWQVKQFFLGQTTNLEKQLKEKEKQAALKLKFEEANYFKNLSIALLQMKQEQIVEINQKGKIDFLGFATNNNLVSLILFSYVNGKLIAKIQEIHEFYDDLNATIISWLYQYYLNSKNKPDNLFVSLPKKDFIILKDVLKIDIQKPIKGKKYKILLNAIDNAIDYLKNNYQLYLAHKKAKLMALMQLAKLININQINTIISFDISNLFNVNKVAGMIYIENGDFIKNKYRKYNLDDDNLASDYDCIKYVIGKFIDHHRNELPDLIIIDGGKVQVSAVLEVFAIKKIVPPKVLGLIKNNKHKTDAIYYNHHNFKLEKKSCLYNFLANIQDEVHNYAISFYRKKHEKAIFSNSILPNIPQLSLAKKQLLLEKYKTTDAIKKATIAELSQIIDPTIAKLLKKIL